MIPATPQGVWDKMRDQLVPLLGAALHIEITDTWSSHYEDWFKELEVQSFRESLRYNSEELQAILREENVLFLFIVSNEIPEGVILGYPVKSESDAVFYFDTFAIRRRGKGIGRIVLRSIIEWAEMSGFKAIDLDTEAMNEIGIPLQKFYEDFGFVVQRIDDDGNIKMRLVL